MGVAATRTICVSIQSRLRRTKSTTSACVIHAGAETSTWSPSRAIRRLRFFTRLCCRWISMSSTKNTSGGTDEREERGWEPADPLREAPAREPDAALRAKRGLLPPARPASPPRVSSLGSTRRVRTGPDVLRYAMPLTLPTRYRTQRCAASRTRPPAFSQCLCCEGLRLSAAGHACARRLRRFLGPPGPRPRSARR